MRAHAEAVWDRFKLFLFLVDAVASPPPPRLMHKRTVCWIHQTYDAVIDAARQIGGEKGRLVLIGEYRHARDGSNRILARGKACTQWTGIGDENPDETIVLFTGVIPRKDSINSQFLICRKRRNEPALSTMRVEFPTVIAAFDLLPIELPARERHTAVRASVAQSKGTAIRIATNHQRNLQQRGLLDLASMNAVRRQSAVPKAGKHERIRRFALQSVCRGGHGMKSAYHGRCGPNIPLPLINVHQFCLLTPCHPEAALALEGSMYLVEMHRSFAALGGQSKLFPSEIIILLNSQSCIVIVQQIPAQE